MSLQSDLIEKIKQLPGDKQLLVKSLVDELTRTGNNRLEHDPVPWFGSLEHLGISITEEDIADARREMWGSFPREVR